MQNRVVKTGLFLIICLIVGIFAGVFSSKYYQQAPSEKPDIAGLLWPNPKIISEFSLQNHNQEPFNLENITGQWTFLFFGYTHCPDICPNTLSVMNHVYENLVQKNQADNVQMLFVSVDPGRDTPEKMSAYVNYFNKDFIGLTGSEEQLKSFTQQMGIVHAKSEETATGQYEVLHTASIFLISPANEWLGIFSAPHNIQDIVERFLAIKKFRT